ncbi:hypothetical protein NXS19_001714 [Fusarium pseudograminearum]|nr:hypothetical protein NXS19_001714 [Fusarium pseudograminearum]
MSRSSYSYEDEDDYEVRYQKRGPSPAAGVRYVASPQRPQTTITHLRGPASSELIVSMSQAYTDPILAPVPGTTPEQGNVALVAHRLQHP